MTPGARRWLDIARGALTTAAVTLALQWLAYWLTVRDDLRDLKRDVADLKCTVAVATSAPTLPDGCHPRLAAVVMPPVVVSKP